MDNRGKGGMKWIQGFQLEGCGNNSSKEETAGVWETVMMERRGQTTDMKDIKCNKICS